VKEAQNEAGIVWRRKKEKGRYMSARNGDMWSAPFQCDQCWFINLQFRQPNLENTGDVRLLGYIRRVNLDLFWSREPSTVSNTMSQIKKVNRLSEDLGLNPVQFPRGPWPVGDGMGFQLAIVTLRASQEPGRNNPSYQQYDSIRKLRTGVSNAFENSYPGNRVIQSFRSEKGKALKMSSCETESWLFIKFMRGLQIRMGREVISNVGIDHRILLCIINNFDKELEDRTVTWKRKRMVIMAGSYMMVCFGASLRGNEGFYLEASELVNMISLGGTERDIEEGTGHVCAPLMGRFKSETGESNHVAVITNISKSGFKFRLWLERLAWVLTKERKELITGPAFCREDGNMIRSFEMNFEFHKALKIVQLERPDLIPIDLDVTDTYGTYRSLRRGSHTKATEEGIDGPDLELINRWRMFETSQGGNPHMSMRQHYLEIRLVLKRTLAYSKVL
jgi:hypothetical protein